MNAFDGYEFEGLSPTELKALIYLWNNFIDFAYSPYEPNISEMHYYMQQMGKLLGDFPPNALPFSGTAKVGEL